MSTEITLILEKRDKIICPEIKSWYNANIFGVFVDTESNEMFARMANLFGTKDELDVCFECRGVPEGFCHVANEFLLSRSVGIGEEEWYSGGIYPDNLIPYELAIRYRNENKISYVDDNRIWMTRPNHHHYSWLTATELKQCFDSAFKNKDGSYKEGYEQWLGLVSYAKSIEDGGRYDCRAIFCFEDF